MIRLSLQEYKRDLSYQCVARLVKQVAREVFIEVVRARFEKRYA
jgi:hypothetical protein